MLICGLQKLSMVDYPEKLAATVFTGGCNLRCPFCHNASLVLRPGEGEIFSDTQVLDFLKTRVGKLDGVCISGGEPLLQPDLEDFIEKVRALGFLIKLDTNGVFPHRLKALLDRGLVDYVAMDVKNTPEKYAQTVGIPGFDANPVFESAAVLMSGSTPYEFRTTLVAGLHTAEDMKRLGSLLAGAEKYYLQSFKDSGDLVGFGSHDGFQMAALPRSDIEAFRNILSGYIAAAEIRG